MEATSPTLDDACKREEERLAELQAKPSLDEAVSFEDELKCSSCGRNYWLFWTALGRRRNRQGRPARTELLPTQHPPASRAGGLSIPSYGGGVRNAG